MNDFTKEELEYLHEIMGSISIAAYPIDEEFLENKIQSLIDNYCDHEECQHEWDGVLISTKPNTGKCKKCAQVCYIAIKDIE